MSLVTVCLLSVSILQVQAQVKEVWKNDVKQEVLWQEVTGLGDLILSTKGGLLAYNTETGTEIWSHKEFAGLERNSFRQIDGSPLISITRPSGISIIEPIKGRELFNSQSAGISEVDTTCFLYSANGILIAGKKGGSKEPVMLMVNMMDGRISWTIDEKFGRIIALEEISSDEILVVTLFTNYRINSSTGKIIWKSSTSNETNQLDKMGALGGALKALAEEASKDMNFDIRFYKRDNDEVFYIGSQKESKSTMGTTTTITYSNIYNAYRISDGTLVWSEPLEMRGKLGQVILDSDGLIVLPDDGNRTLINKFDYTSKAGKWGKKAKGIPVKGGIYDYVGTEKGYVLVTHSGGKNYLNFLDPAQGLLTFEEPLKINGTVVGIIPVARGILFVTTQEINIMDPATGQFVMPESVVTRPELTAERENKIFAFDTEKKKVVSIDMEKATVQIISGMPLAFEGKEIPGSLELRENGIFLSSEQNVALVGYDGNQAYRNYFPAPREPGLKRALLYAQSVRAAYISANSYYASAAFRSAAPQANDAATGALLQGVGDVYGQLGDATADFAKASFQQANKRFKATVNGRDFLIILTQTDKVIELVKVNKNTGAIDGRVDLGKDRSPEYAVDDVNGQIYLKTALSTIASYKFY